MSILGQNVIFRALTFYFQVKILVMVVIQSGKLSLQISAGSSEVSSHTPIGLDYGPLCLYQPMRKRDGLQTHIIIWTNGDKDGLYIIICTET